MVTNRGGRTCHAAIVRASWAFPPWSARSSDRAARERRYGHRFLCRGRCRPDLRGCHSVRGAGNDLECARTAGTRIMINLGNPELAFKTAMIPNDGVGLARLEFIVSEYCESTSDGARSSGEGQRCGGAERRAVRPLVSRLHAPVGVSLSLAWQKGSPPSRPPSIRKPVVIRLSDFKVNEYRAPARAAPLSSCMKRIRCSVSAVRRATAIRRTGMDSNSNVERSSEFVRTWVSPT